MLSFSARGGSIEMMSGFGFGGLWMMAAWALFWVFVVAGIAWLALTLSRQQTRSADGASAAVKILEERLARGEIDAEEFRMRRAAIAGATQ